VNNFILTYNPLLLFPGEARLLNHVKINKHVEQYYQPYLGTFIFKSREGITTINDSFQGLFQDTPYMVVMFAPAAAGGALSHEAWNWINTGWIPNVAPPPPRTNALAAAILDWKDKNS
jgi:hypothetical protein